MLHSPKQDAFLKVLKENKSVLVNQFVHPTLCLYLAFTSINFRGMLHPVCNVAYDENMCEPIRTRKCRTPNWLISYMIKYFMSQ